MLKELIKKKDLFLDEAEKVTGITPEVYEDDPDYEYVVYKLGNLTIRVSRIDNVIFDIEGVNQEIESKLEEFLKGKKSNYKSLETFLIFVKEKKGGAEWT